MTDAPVTIGEALTLLALLLGLAGAVIRDRQTQARYNEKTERQQNSIDELKDQLRDIVKSLDTTHDDFIRHSAAQVQINKTAFREIDDLNDKVFNRNGKKRKRRFIQDGELDY